MNNISKKQTDIKNVKKRAAILLSFLVIISLISLLATGYVGAQTGELDKKLLEPIKKRAIELVQFIYESQKEQPLPENPPVNIETESKVNVKININSNISSGSGGINSKQGTRINWVYPSYPPSASYEQTREFLDEWWQKVQAENKTLSEQSQASLENFRTQSLQNLENFKLEGQQGMEQFRQQMEIDQQQFLQKYGVNP